MTESRKPGSSSAVDDLERLRDLILGEKSDRLDDLYQRVSDPESRTGDVAEVLPGAMGRVIEDPIARPEIERPIVDTIRSAIKHDTASFAEALFPVLGPAIRRAVADSLKGLVERINAALEQSFTVKGLRWRVEAARSGVPFGQIVLRHTMVFAVQEVFLIQPRSGLVLASAHRDDTLALDEDAFSAMLTAIQAFIQDSLGMPDDEQLRSAELGDRTLWVIKGPGAVLACLIIGSPPHEVRRHLADVLETLHARFGDELDRPPEQLSDPAGVNALLQETLKGEVAQSARKPANSRYKQLWVGVGLALLSILAWSAWSAYRANRTEQILTRLFEAEPGYVLTSHDTRGGQLFFTGLRDPLARSPESMLQDRGVDMEHLTLAFRPYQSLEEPIVLQRLRAALGSGENLVLEVDGAMLQVRGSLTSAQYSLLEQLPGAHPVIHTVNLAQARLDPVEAAVLVRQRLNAPPSVVISAAEDRIELSGTASAGWFGAATAGEKVIGGWPLDFTPLRGTLANHLDELQNGIDGRTVLFSRQLEFSPGTLNDIDTLGREMAELQDLAAVLQVKLTISLEGFADGSGTQEENRELALMRARTLQSELVNRGIDPASISLETGHWLKGSVDPVQRKVVVHVVRESGN